MTDITKHVTSLELSRELKEAGVPQKSLFIWVENSGIHECTYFGDGEDDFSLILSGDYMDSDIDKGTEEYSAFLASELGEMLPGEINLPFKNRKKRLHNHFLLIKKCSAGFKNMVSYLNWNSQEQLHERAETEANARGKMLLYLIKEGLVDVKSLGK